MKRWIAVVIAVAAGAAVASGTLYASDPTAVYARVDRVALAPNAEAPDTIQVWGVFSIATPDNRNDYQVPEAGYLYFKLAGDPTLARREWADLKAVAGTKQIVSFGNRSQLKPRVRKATATAEAPDAYVTNAGMTRVRADTTYAPIKALIDYRK